MRFLIVEDDEISQKVLLKYLLPLGECDIAADGQEAVEKFTRSIENDNLYDLVTMDIMMPILDGQEALKEIRKVEKEHDIEDVDKIKVVMTTALGNPKNVVEAFYKGGATAYLIKPIEKKTLYTEMQKLGFNLDAA